MAQTTRKLVTVVAEAILEQPILKDLRRLGAHGWTITEARGEGHRGRRSADWEESRNIRIEIVCDAATAERIQTHLRDTYYQNYAMITWMADVDVMRPAKF